MESEINRKGFGWIKLLLLGALLLAAYAFFNNYSKEDPVDVVKDQLKAIKSNKITEAYYAYTSKDFQSVTSLDKFKEFVKSYPVFAQNQSADFKLKDGPNEDVKIVDGDIIGANKKFMPVEYQLILEDDKWKILYMKFLTENPINTKSERDAAINSPVIKDSMIATVKSFLDDLKGGLYGNAYTNYTTSAFQTVTSMESFRQFIEAYPIIYQYNKYQFGDYILEGSNGNLNVVLDDNDEKASLVFNLNKESANNWKIQGIQHLEQSKNTQEVPDFNSKNLVKVIQDQISAIKQGELGRAYYDFTTEDFRKDSTFAQFSNFVNANPSLVFNSQVLFEDLKFEKNTAFFTVVLTATKGPSRRASYELVMDNGNWKIRRITLIDNAGANVQSQTTTSVPLQFEKAVFGTQVDNTGTILDPSNIIKSNQSEIYINLYVKRAVAGDIIQVQFEYTENSTKIPIMAYTLPTDGDQMVTFSFAPPRDGWPKGGYRITLTSLSGGQKAFPFTIE